MKKFFLSLFLLNAALYAATGQSIPGYFGPSGGVTVLKSGTSLHVFTPAADTDTARGSALAQAWTSFDPGDSMSIEPGTYEVSGTTQYLFSGYGGQTISGAGMDVTTIKMGNRGVGATPLYVLFNWYVNTLKGGASNVTVRDLTLDGNLQNQSQSSARAGGIFGFGSHFLVERIHVINFGSKGAVPENFTILLGASGYGPDFGNVYDCVIRDCVADQARGISTSIGSGFNPFIISGGNVPANALTAPPSWNAIGTSSSSSTMTTVTTSVAHHITPTSSVTMFDGGAVYFTTDSVTNVLTLHGATVAQDIVGGLIQISGGANFLPGFYGIAAQSGTAITLYTAPCTAAAGGGIGAIVPEVHASVTIRGHSVASVNGTWLPQITGSNTFVISVASTGGTGGEEIEESGWVIGAKILNCTVRNIGAGINQPPFVHGSGFAWVANGEIAHCTFENLTSVGCGIYEDTGAIYGQSYHDNSFINCTNPIRLAIDDMPAINGLDIYNNDISLTNAATTEGIIVYPLATGSNVQIRNNVIHGGNGADGIALRKLDGVIVEGNTIDVGGQAIHVYSNVTNLSQNGNRNSAGVVVGTPLALWRSAKFGADVDNQVIAGDAADPDHDGVPNLLEYALGLDPKIADRASLPAGIEPGGYVSYTYTRVLAATDISYVIEQSDNLNAGWTAASVVNEILSDDGVTQRIKANIPRGNAHELFLRLKVAH